MIKHLNKIIGITGFGISILLIIFYPALIVKLTNFANNNIGINHPLDGRGIMKLKSVYFILISSLVILSTVFTFNINRIINNFISKYIDLVKIKEFFLKDEICNKKQTSIYIIAISTISGLLLLSYEVLFGPPCREGVIDAYGSCLYFISGIILIISIAFFNKESSPSNIRKQIKLFYSILSLLLFCYFGEEISWGQQIFHWKSPDLFAGNYQNETNIHNYFNPLFKYIYPALGFSTFIVLFFIWFFPNNKSYIFQLLIPPVSLFFLLFMMAISSFMGFSETYEALLGIFILLYSIRVFICLKGAEGIKP